MTGFGVCHSLARSLARSLRSSVHPSHTRLLAASRLQTRLVSLILLLSHLLFRTPVVVPTPSNFVLGSI
jgi:hypothetical protein